jgi:hypothetical protein
LPVLAPDQADGSNRASLRINCSAGRGRDRRYRLSIKGVPKTDFLFRKIIEVLIPKVKNGGSESVPGRMLVI